MVKEYLVYRHLYYRCILPWTLLLFCKPTENRLDTILRTSGSGFPGGAVVENLPVNAGDTGSSPGLGQSHMLQSD